MRPFNRSVLIGAIGVAIVIVAIALSFLSDPGDGPDQAAAPQEGTSATLTRPPGAAPDVAPNAPPDSTQAPVAPSFDIVRVNSEGNAVIAGRAAANATVTVRNRSGVIGTVTADPRGEWVLVPEIPLKPGSHELSVTAWSPDGTATEGESNVVIVVPERGKDLAGRPQDRPSGALALKVPGAGPGATTVLQAPLTGSPPAEGAPVVEAVDFGTQKGSAVTGRAQPGARLEVYLDNKHVGATTADAQGHWTVRPGEAIEPGEHSVRVDQLGSGNAVTARAEVTFDRAASLGDLPVSSVVFVEPGNSLWRIARRIYGQGIQYSLIFDANREQIRNPDLIYPGQIFVVPRGN